MKKIVAAASDRGNTVFGCKSLPELNSCGFCIAVVYLLAKQVRFLL